MAVYSESESCVDAELAILNGTYKSAPLTVISSVLSMLGSALIIVSYVLWKDLRKSTARAILLFLAIADFMTSIGYFWSAIAYLSIFYVKPKPYGTSYKIFQILCKIESFWDTYFPVASFFWTANLAIYFVVTLVFLKGSFAKKLMIPFHLTAWLIPLIICICGVSTGWLGPSNIRNGTEDTTAGAWCFVSSIYVTNITDETDFRNKASLYYLMEAVFGKGIEIGVYIVVIVCYTIILSFNRCKSKSKITSSVNPYTTIHLRTRQYINLSMANVDLKLLLIPFLFICIRSGGTLRFLISALYEGCRIPVFHELRDGICINKSCFTVLYNQGLIDFQAFCDPLQGFVNGVIFAFLSKAVSERLINCIGIPVKGLIKCISYPVTQCYCSKRHHIEGYSPVANRNIINDEDRSLLQDVEFIQ